MILCRTKKRNYCYYDNKNLLPKKKGDILYFIQIGEVENKKRLIKIGTTNNLKRRMSEELRQYQKDIKIIWVSAIYSKFTTLRIEERQKELWKTFNEWEYLPNDRFLIPSDIQDFKITVRRDWEFSL